MYDWVLYRLADQFGVAPPQPGEGIAPNIRLEQPWPQWLFVFTALGSIALICWLYRHEGKASTASKVALAAIRIALVLLAMFMLSEAVLSVERTGLPYLAILIDDSESEGIVDQYDKPEVKTGSTFWPLPRGPRPRVTRPRRRSKARRRGSTSPRV